jgi:hypothetical protein
MGTLRSFADQLAQQDPRYFERVRTRGQTPNVFNDPRLVRRVFAGTTKERHADLANIRMMQASAAESAYDKYLKYAIAHYGDLEPGVGAVSGIYNPAFPESVKEKLRSLKDYHVYRDAAQIHWNASGRRGAMPKHAEVLLPPGTRRG